MLRIPSKFSASAFESVLSKITSSNVSVSIPKNIKSSLFGGLPMYIQFLSTWFDRSSENTIYIESKGVGDSYLEEFMDSIHGLAAVNFSNSVFFDGEELDRGDVLRRSLGEVDRNMSYDISKLRKKTSFPVYCIDNSHRIKFPNILYYNDKGDLRQIEEFRRVTERVLREIYPENRRGDIGLAMIDAVSNFFYEGFINTHQHARRDILGNIITRSMRGVVFDIKTVSVDSVKNEYSDDNPINNYFEDWVSDFSQAKNAKFLEVSIFDSGPGMANTWLARKKPGQSLSDLSAEAELAAISSCLRLGQTAKDNVARGNGLFRVMVALKRVGGILRIRSGRLALIKTFSGERFDQLDDDDFECCDFFTGSKKPELREQASGLTITALFPINKKGVGK